MKISCTERHCYDCNQVINTLVVAWDSSYKHNCNEATIFLSKKFDSRSYVLNAVLGSALTEIPMIRPKLGTPSIIKMCCIYVIIQRLHLPYFVANKLLPFPLPHRRHTATMKFVLLSLTCQRSLH